MDNVKYTLTDDEVLMIAVDLKCRNGLSVSTKSVKIATSEGSQCLKDRHEFINVNVWIPKKHNTRGLYTDEEGNPVDD